MKLHALVDSLRAHEASVGIALLELLRRADDRGSLDRGEWLTAISAAVRRPHGIG